MDLLALVAFPVHIAAAALWIGCAVVFHGFVEPATERNGESGERVLLKVLAGPFTPVITAASLTTIATGSVLYAHLIGSGRLHDVLAGAGLGYTLGAAATLLAVGIACTVTGPNTLRLIRLAKQLDACVWAATPAQRDTLRGARARPAVGGRVATLLLGTALVAMSLAR